MAIPYEDQKSLADWNANHPYEDQYNTSTGNVIPGSAQQRPTPTASVPKPGTTGRLKGDSIPTATKNNTSVKSSGGGSGGGGGSPSGAPSLATPTPTVDQNTMAQQYGMTMGMLNAYPELKTLFNQAVAGTWTPDRFQAAFRNTDWYKGMSDTHRKAAIMSFTDPATWSNLWNSTQTHIRGLMGDLGSDTNNWEQINAAAGKVIWEGWNDDQARNYLGQYVVFGNGGLAGGKAGAAQQELNSYAYAMGVQNSDNWTQDAVRNVVRGQGNVQDYKNQIMNQAIATFPGWEKQLRAGSTMQDVAAPYMQSMSQILEMPAGNINLFDNTIRGALSWKDPSGQAASKPLWQFQNDLRQDDRWSRTQNAQDAAMGTAHRVLQDYGMVS